MIDALVGFVAVLRHHGFDVGTDRTLAAARSLAHVDLADRAATQRTLRITLVAHRLDAARFDDLFDRWFAGWPGGIGLAASGDDTDRGDGVWSPPMPVAGVELSPETERRRRDGIGRDAYVDDPSERIGVTSRRTEAAGADPVHAVVDPDGDPVVATVDGSVGVGAMHAGGDPAPDAQRPARPSATIRLDVADDVGPVLDRLAVERRRRLEQLRPQSPAPSAHGARARTLLANPFDDAERQVLRRAVDALRPQLVGVPSWRHRPGADGELDLRRTLRRSATTAGTPIDLRHRDPVRSRASVLVLVDTSLSVRPTARLMLHLAHRLRAAVGGVRVLAFIDRCIDVTDVIRHADLAVALGRLLDDAPGGALDPARPSDYGAAMRSLWSRHAGLVRPATTVIVLGDGRSNGRDPGVAAVSALTERCRRSVWLTPEPPGAWGFGNGEMAQYAEVVDVAWTVRTLDDLAELAASGRVAAPWPGQRVDGGRWRYRKASPYR